jgi:hypothetical protein
VHWFVGTLVLDPQAQRSFALTRPPPPPPLLLLGEKEEAVKCEK